MQQKLALVTCLLFMSTPLLIPSSAQGTVISFSLEMEFSGATPPEGPTPWMIATFDDQGTPGSVDLTLEAVSLCVPVNGVDESEFVFEWLFNFDPLQDSSALVFTQTGKTGEFTDPTVNLADDFFRADGDGNYDIQVLFAATNGPKTKFGCPQPGKPIETVTFTITAPTLPDITANSFAYLSAPGPDPGDPGPFPTAAKIGGIGELDGSGWITVPEPVTCLFFALGSLALVQQRKRKR